MGQGQSQYISTSYGITSSILRFIIVKLVVFDMGICHCQEAVALWLRYKVNKKTKIIFFSSETNKFKSKYLNQIYLFFIVLWKKWGRATGVWDFIAFI